MLGRIVFLHFLQKKGWLGCPAGSTKWNNGDKQFMQTLFRLFPDKDHFYSRCLSQLFFNTLNNSDRPGFVFQVEGISPCRVPYLNGGLFDPDLRPDGNPITGTIDLPADYFDSLLQFFDQYNFTIDENSPNDYEVGIDPEMLGHIFENLLEENREKGAFYTPKEIVQYMCQESLIQHLTHKLTNELGESHRPAILGAMNTLIRGGSRGDEKNRHNLITLYASQIERLLDELKICDPAIGSGAFPMGMLQEIFAAKMTLDLTLNRADVKKRIISETIYGVDMEPGAVDIARLRFWLSLVVEEEVAEDKNPEPLPNLDYKIMQGDSLLESFEGVIPLTVTNSDSAQDPTQGIMKGGQLNLDGRSDDTQLGLSFAFGQPASTMTDQRKARLRKLIRKYFKAGNKNEKASIRQQINDEIDKHIDECIRAEQAKWTREKNKILGELIIARQGQRSAKSPAKQREYEKSIARKERELERFQRLLADELEREKRLESSKNTLEKGYFLWRLFFPEVFEQGGFDIVIANPPYLQLARIPAEAAQYKAEGYKTFEKTGDIYGLFYEQGLKLLKQDGLLTYITSNSWLQTQYGKPLRQLFVEQADPLTLLNFEDTRLFETAVVETNILIARKGVGMCRHQLQAATVGADFDKDKETLPAYIAQHAFTLTDLPAEGWAVGDEQASLLKKKMEENGKKLGEWEVSINFGLKTGYNTAFIIEDESQYQSLINADGKNSEIIKPTLRGRDLRRYVYNFSKQWIIVTHNGLRSEGIPPVNVYRDYPTIFNYLQQFLPKIEQRSDQGNHWSNLRNCAYLKDFEKPKIIWGELSDEAKFTYDDAGHYVEATIFMLTGASLKYLLSVLNSKPSQWYFQQITTTSGMGTNRWKKYKIEQLPVPKPTAEIEAQLTALVDKVLALKKGSSSADTLAYEAQIDALVFNAYGLNESEMLYVLDQFPTIGSVEREQIRNNFRNLERGHFSVLA